MLATSSQADAAAASARNSILESLSKYTDLVNKVIQAQEKIHLALSNESIKAAKTGDYFTKHKNRTALCAMQDEFNDLYKEFNQKKLMYSQQAFNLRLIDWDGRIIPQPA